MKEKNYTLVACDNTLRQADIYLSSNGTIIFDTEKDQKNVTAGPDLIQIFDTSYLFIFPKHYKKGYEFAKQLLCQSNELVGYGIENDLKWLLEVNCELSDVLDLSKEIQGRLKLEQPISLKDALDRLVSYSEFSDNNLARSEWSSKNLTKQQLEYAATDVINISSLWRNHVDHLQAKFRLQQLKEQIAYESSLSDEELEELYYYDN